MRIYDGSPRQDFEEVFRSIGAFLDARGMRDILMLEVSDGFVVQGLVSAGASAGAWSDTIGTVSKETLQFLDDDIAKFMEEAMARRGRGAPEGPGAGVHERALRVVGRWMDEQKPRTCSCSSRTARTSSASTSRDRPAPTTCSRSSRRTTSTP